MSNPFFGTEPQYNTLTRKYYNGKCPVTNAPYRNTPMTTYSPDEHLIVLITNVYGITLSFSFGFNAAGPHQTGNL